MLLNRSAAKGILFIEKATVQRAGLQSIEGHILDYRVFHLIERTESDRDCIAGVRIYIESFFQNRGIHLTEPCGFQNSVGIGAGSV